MKERIVEAIKVILLLGLSIAIIAFLYIHEGRTPSPSNALPVTQDTIAAPEFYSQTAKEGLYSALIYYGLYHPDIVYAQAILETGHFKSRVCINCNNLFGLYDSKNKRYYEFEHWTESVVAYKKWIQKRYEPSQNYYSFLERIHYATDPSYTQKLKQIVKGNEKRRSIGACSSDSSSLCTSSIPNRIWEVKTCY